MNLENKIVFITGASSGIGKAAAYQFAGQGAKLILTARRVEKLNELSKEIKEKYQVDGGFNQQLQQFTLIPNCTML